MPRPSNTFTEGAFGPLSPIIPAPIDVPRQDTGRPEPRRFQYPVGWNLPIGVPGTEGLKLVPFSNLRQYAEVYSVVRACIELRKQEILALEWDVVPTEGAEKKMRADPGAHMDFMSRKEQAVAFFNHPDPNYNSFASWMSAILEDIFVVDALAVYLHPSRQPGKGLFGTDLAALDVLDGTTIRPLLDIRGGTPKPPAPAYQQYMFGIPRVDMMDVIMQNDIKDLGEPAAQYRGDQMLYLRTVPRTWTPYGFPGLERAIIPIITGIKKQQYAMDWFTEGTIPGSWVIPGPDVATPAQQRELQETLNAIAGDVGFKHKIIVLPPGSKSEAQKPLVLADQFDEVLMNQVMMAYEITPMELGVLPKVSATQSPSAANQAQQSSSGINERKALKPMLMWLKRELFDYVLQRYCGQTDMQWSWKALDTNTDEQIQAATYKTLVSTGLMSVDEARVEMGKNPWGLPQTSDPVLITGTGVIPFGQISPEEANAALGVPPIANPDEVAAAVQQQQAQAQSAAMGGTPPGAAPKPPGTPPAAPPGGPPAGGAPPSTPPSGGAPTQPGQPPTGGAPSGPVHPKTGEPLQTDPKTGKPLHPTTGKPMHSDNPMLKPEAQASAAKPGTPPGAPQAAAAAPPQHPASGAATPAPGAQVPPHATPPPPSSAHELPPHAAATPPHATSPATGQPVPNAHTATPEHAALAGHGAPAATPATPPRVGPDGKPMPPQGPPPVAPTPKQPTDPTTGHPVPSTPPGGAHAPQGAPPPHPGAAPAAPPVHPKTGEPLKTNEEGKPLHPETGKPLHADSPLLQNQSQTSGSAAPQHSPTPAPTGAQPPPQHPAAPPAAQHGAQPPGKPADPAQRATHNAGQQPAPTPSSPHDGTPIPPQDQLACPMCGGNGRNQGKPCTECKGTGFIDGNVDPNPQPAQGQVAGMGPQPSHPGASPLGPDGKPLPPSREPGAPNPQMQGGQRPQMQGNRASQEANTQTTPHNPVMGGGGAPPPSTQARKPAFAKRSQASQAMLDELEMLKKHLKKQGTGGRRWEAEFLPQTMVDSIYDELDAQRNFFE